MNKSKLIALNFLKQVEGIKLKAYLDTGGVKTIGYGHTGEELPDEITLEQAATYLEDDLEKVFMRILPMIKVQLNDNQLAAVLSFAFNVGCNAFRDSTLLKKINKSDFIGAVAEFERWVYDNGRYVEGLKNRRHKEMDLFRA